MASSKKILLTGGGGFIGKNLQELLGGVYDIQAPGSEELDLLNTKQVADYLGKRHFDVIIHAAGNGISRTQADFSDIFENNTRMFLNLAENHSAFERLIVFGSGAEYDKSRSLVKVKENEFGQSKPEDEYGRAKYFIAEQIQKASGVVDLRCFGVFGKYEDYATRFISNAICRSLAGLPIVMNQNKVFGYVYINDLAKITAHFISNDPKEKFYNVDTGGNIDLKYLAEIVKSATGSRTEIHIKKSGLGLEYSGNNSLLIKELGDFKFTPFEESIEEMVKWYQDNWQNIDQSKLNFDA